MAFDAVERQLKRSQKRQPLSMASVMCSLNIMSVLHSHFSVRALSLKHIMFSYKKDHI